MNLQELIKNIPAIEVDKSQSTYDGAAYIEYGKWYLEFNFIVIREILTQYGDGYSTPDEHTFSEPEITILNMEWGYGEELIEEKDLDKEEVSKVYEEIFNSIKNNY